MLLVDSDAVGQVAFARLIRDGFISPATRRFALPADIASSPGIRAWCVSPSVPAHTVLSGLAGLWVWHGEAWPGEVTVVGMRGLHRSALSHAASDKVSFHSGIAWRDPATRIGPIAVASPARCCADALRWDRHSLALVAVAAAVAGRLVSVEAIAHEVRRDSPQGAGYARLTDVWRVLSPVLRALERPHTHDAGAAPRLR